MNICNMQRAFILALARFDFLHLCMVQSYNFVFQHALCSSNNVLLSVAFLCKLSKGLQSLESYVAASCEIEFCSITTENSSSFQRVFVVNRVYSYLRV